MAKSKKIGTCTAKLIVQSIESMRMQKGWSKEETALRLRLKYSTYQNYIAGRTIPTVDILDNAERVFNIPVWKFLIPIQEQIKEAVWPKKS